MDEQMKNDLKQLVKDILDEDFEIALTELKRRIVKFFIEEKNIDLKLNKDDNNLIKQIRSEIVGSKLKYKSTIDKKGKKREGCTFIEKKSMVLEKLVKELSLKMGEDDFENLVLLTPKNADAIEKQIKSDDDYIPFAESLCKYFVKECGKDGFKKNKDKSLFTVIREIDRDNSTNVWRYKSNRESLRNAIEFIVNDENEFFERLERGDKTLPDAIVKKCGTGLKSLSSKICKYLSEFIFNKDNYYINDKFVRRSLLFYWRYYFDEEHPDYKLGSDIDVISYKKLHELLEKINEKSAEVHKCNKLKKSELDHIIWYCYKSYNT